MEFQLGNDHAVPEIKQYILKMDDPDILKLMLSPAEKLEVDKMVDLFKEFEEVTKEFQMESTALMRVRNLLDAALHDYPKLQLKLGSNAPFIHSGTFELAKYRIQCEKDAKLEAARTDLRLQDIAQYHSKNFLRSCKA